jgi:hypothetical protein
LNIYPTQQIRFKVGRGFLLTSVEKERPTLLTFDRKRDSTFKHKKKEIQHLSIKNAFDKKEKRGLLFSTTSIKN